MVAKDDALEEHPMIQRHGLLYLEEGASGVLVSSCVAP